MSNSYNVRFGNVANVELNEFGLGINSNLDLLTLSEDEISHKTQELINKEQIQINQLTEIKDKEKLLLTRSRMLQISQDRNAYKKQLIYTSIASAIAIFILIIVVYNIIRKRKV